jgi:hypothetical protein
MSPAFSTIEECIDCKPHHCQNLSMGMKNKVSPKVGLVFDQREYRCLEPVRV